MRLAFDADDGFGRCSLRAVAASEDRFPRVDRLLLDAAPDVVDFDRLAVAGALLFGSPAQDKLEFEFAVSVDVREMIADEFRVSVEGLGEPMAFDASAIRATELLVRQGVSVARTTPRVDKSELVLVPSERFYGSLRGVKELVLGSNAWFLSHYIPSSTVNASVGLMYSRDLLAQTVNIGTGSESKSRAQVERLLVGVGLDVKTEETE